VNSARWRFALVAATLGAATGAAVGQQAEPDPVAAGRRFYTGYCTRCHGINLVTVGIGFDLRTFPKDDKERFLRSVNKGVRNMPAFEGIAKPEQIEAIWAYIGSVNGWTK